MIESQGIRKKIRWARQVLLFCVILAMEANCPPVLAQQDNPAAPAIPTPSLVTLPTTEELDGRIKQIKEQRDQQPSDEQKKSFEVLLDIYSQANSKLGEIQKFEASIAEYRKARLEAPDRLTAVREQIAQIPEQPRIEEDFTNWSPEQIEQQLARVGADLANARKAVADRDAEVKSRTDRRTVIPEASARAKEQLKVITEQPVTKPVAEESAEMSKARRILLLTTQKALETELKLYDEEIMSYDARKDLLPARRDLAVLQESYYAKLVKQWQDILDRRRKVEAEKTAKLAQKIKQEAAQAHPKIQELAAENAKLAELRSGPQGLVAINSAKAAWLKKIEKDAADLDSDFNRVKEKVKTAGLTDVIGVILLKKRDALPDVRSYRRSIQERRQETAKARFEWLKYDERYAALADIDGSSKAIINDLDLTADKQAEYEPEIKKLLQSQRDILKALVDEYDAYLSILSDLDVAERQLVTKTQEYRDYINEHILWIRNTSALDISVIRPAWQAVLWVLSPLNWWQVVEYYVYDVRGFPIRYAFTIGLFLFFYYLRHKLRSRMIKASARVHQKYSDQFTLTLRALFYTFLLALYFPAILAFLGWRLVQSYSTSEFTSGVAAGLISMAQVYFVLEFFRIMTLPEGLAVKHFKMPESAGRFLQRQASWLMVCLLPLAFLFATIEKQTVASRQESLGRIALILRLVTLSVFFLIILRPSRELLKEILERKREGWLNRLRLLWYPLAFTFPLVLALTAGIGYQYAAAELSTCLQTTILLILSILLLSTLLSRWVSVTQAKLAIRRASQRQSTMTSKSQAEQGPGEDQPETNLELETEKDLYRISQQTRRFLNVALGLVLLVGLWLIWSKNLPALRFLDKVELWTITVENQQVSISLANLTWALVIVLATVLAARNILGLLEIMILQRLPLDSGVRFAIVTLSRYLIVITGLVIAFSKIGIGWSKVQWLVAAMTVGLGFGLQEIFANFVSGLIILFEQPMRIGDTVTVGDISGKVTRIRIRATTIRGWDRKELVVPNKEFITGRLVNWTLSDTILRMQFPVGIAYGSDTALAEKTLLEVAHRQPKVLAKPEPFVIFKAFGESSLEFELRLFIPDLDSYLTVWHGINRAIDAAFRKAHIEIAFPQRDLHLRSITGPIPIKTQEKAE